MGFIGQAEGVAVQSIATLKYYNWKQNEYINYWKWNLSCTKKLYQDCLMMVIAAGLCESPKYR